MSANTPPVVSATGTTIILLNKWVRLSDLVSISNPGGGALLGYQIVDGNSAAGSAQEWNSGLYGAQGGTFNIAAGVSLNDIWLGGGTTPGINSFTIQAQDTNGWSNALVINLAVRTSNTVSVISGTTTGVVTGQSVAATSLINVTDLDGDTPTIYHFWDNGAGGGHFALNGTTQAAFQIIEVAAADVGNLTYVSAGAASSETL